MTLSGGETAELYLDLIKKCLTRSAFPDTYGPAFQMPRGMSKEMRRRTWPLGEPLVRVLYPAVARMLARYGFKLYLARGVVQEHREGGLDWPLEADTMVGHKRLDNLHACVKSVLAEGIPGDFIETGVWRGGCSILMRAALRAYGDTTRYVYLADSFEGMPKPNGRCPQDAGDDHWMLNGYFGVPAEQVATNFSRYGLLDDHVIFIKGWFRDTLPLAPIERLAILRLDGDLYESTMDGLVNLYPKLSPGGYVIVDDYWTLQACNQAVDDYRASRQIKTPIEEIDGQGVFWRKDAA